MFYIKVKDLLQRQEVIRELKERGVDAVFHYVPLHSSPAGQKYGRFHGEDRYTTSESNRLIRLPMWYGLTADDLNRTVARVAEALAQSGIGKGMKRS